MVTISMHSIPQKQKSQSRPSLLIRHRWIYITESNMFRCSRAVPASLYESPDPLCYGCRSVIHQNDVPGYPDAYRPSVMRNGETIGTDARLESLGVRLDLLNEELKLQGVADRFAPMGANDYYKHEATKLVRNLKKTKRSRNARIARISNRRAETQLGATS